MALADLQSLASKYDALLLENQQLTARVSHLKARKTDFKNQIAFLYKDAVQTREDLDDLIAFVESQDSNFQGDWESMKKLLDEEEGHRIISDPSTPKSPSSSSGTEERRQIVQQIRRGSQSTQQFLETARMMEITRTVTKHRKTDSYRLFEQSTGPSGRSSRSSQATPVGDTGEETDPEQYFDM